MKQAILVLLLTVSTTICFGRTHAISRPGPGDSVAIIPSTAEMLQQIIDVTGLQLHFELKSAKVLNIEASISHHKRYISYNPAYITWINNLTRNKWAVMTLLAHEIGHHLNGHTIKKKGSSPSLELEADEFAGFIMAKLGATLIQSQEVMKYIAKIETSSTHPGRNARMLAIEKGWNKATIAEKISLLVK